MKKNIGTFDRLIRISLAAIFAILFFTHSVNGVAGIILLVFSGIFLLTAFMSNCPLYLPLGIKTVKTETIKHVN